MFLMDMMNSIHDCKDIDPQCSFSSMLLNLCMFYMGIGRVGMYGLQCLSSILKLMSKK